MTGSAGGDDGDGGRGVELICAGSALFPTTLPAVAAVLRSFVTVFRRRAPPWIALKRALRSSGGAEGDTGAGDFEGAGITGAGGGAGGAAGGGGVGETGFPVDCGAGPAD